MIIIPGYAVRPFDESDREATLRLGQPVVDWWNERCPSLHRVIAPESGGDIAGHLQVADRSFPEPSRRPGECQMRLTVASEHRRRGLGGALYDLAEAFAKERNAISITAAYLESADNPDAAAFLSRRGFVPFERYHPSHLDLASFDPERFSDLLDRVAKQGIRLLTYAEAGDTLENRRRLYELETAARSAQPFREAGGYLPPAFDAWEDEMEEWEHALIFLAASGDEWVGLITTLEWGFTGTHPDWHGRGIASALKVRALTCAKEFGMKRIETENHEDNKAMLAINRKLGFEFDPVEANCMKKLRE